MSSKRGKWRKRKPPKLPPCNRVPLMATEEGRRFYVRDQRTGQIRRRYNTRFRPHYRRVWQNAPDITIR